ncbi:MAG: leucine-rich repeat domain-containing protein [Acetatifactor sp.]|nr:leucine-rich repeat domain-containing protein [Acetatifactor sp.]
MRIKWNVVGILLIITAILIMQIPVPEADAASSASDFRIEGTTLIGYTGTASDVSIPSTVKVIGEGAFQNNTNITRVTIPKNVEEIKPYAFWGCDHLEQGSLGEGLYEVGDYAFANCPELRNISFPDNITRIGIMAFADCASLRNIKIPYTVRSVHDTAFDGCYRLEIDYDNGTEGERFALYFAEKRKEMPEYEDIDEYEEVVTAPAEDPQEGDELTSQPDSQETASDKFLENIISGIAGATAQSSLDSFVK